MTNVRFGTSRKIVIGACLLLMLGGGSVCGGAVWYRDPTVAQSWLLAVLLWSGISIGSIFWLVLHRLVGGVWGEALRPGLIAVTRPLWLMTAATIPLWLALPDIYPWANAEIVAADPQLAAKAAYLNVGFFQIRGAGYLGLCLVVAGVLTSPVSRGRYGSAVAAIGLPGMVFAGTFAAVDWMMSLEPHWYSSVYGLVILAGQAVAGLAAGVIWTDATAPQRAAVSDQTGRDIGNLLLAAVCFWMYLVATQFLIIWSGNLAEETPWYLARARGGRQWVIAAVVLLHFVVPFWLLLSRYIKQHSRCLARVAGLLLVMHAVELWWLVVPAFRRIGTWPHLLDLLAVATLGSAWLAVVLLFPPSSHRQPEVAPE